MNFFFREKRKKKKKTIQNNSYEGCKGQMATKYPLYLVVQNSVKYKQTLPTTDETNQNSDILIWNQKDK